MSRKQLGAAQGIEAACILFQLNSKTADILRLAENAGLPSVFIHGSERTRLCAEWRAFVHAVVTAGLMQHAPNSVLVGYLRQTGHLLRAAEADAPDGRVAPEAPPAQADFVDGPFASYMALLGHGEQAGCPPLFCRRLADAAPELAPQLAQDTRVQARLAAVMALVVSAVWDKLEEFEILAD
ncbi:MAG: serine/threonine protein kinase [Desulfovibrio sp.]|uniref:serine/threonine protein kinase n=1 Tax=Desulfovibrio sp. TaxID=885 RepID=UPI002586DE38|nr:serine/threonine protein kinase [Desulfovibrio sp.]MCD7983839.1 serine/threonine protein kinase [Desulfovibrio sp.]